MIGSWHYRAERADERGTVNSGFLWDVRESQSWDMIRGGAHNVLVVLGRARPDVVQGESPINVQASNTINFWWITVARAGVPARLIAPVVAALLAGLVGSFLAVWRRDGADVASGSQVTR